METVVAGETRDEAQRFEQNCFVAAEELGYQRLHGEWFAGALTQEIIADILVRAKEL
jgi:hypothetical protein